MQDLQTTRYDDVWASAGVKNPACSHLPIPGRAFRSLVGVSPVDLTVKFWKASKNLSALRLVKKTELPGRKSFSSGKSIRQKTKGFGLSCHFRALKCQLKAQKTCPQRTQKHLIDSQDFQEKWLDRIYLVLDLTACSPSPRTFKKTEPWLPLKLTLSLRHA